MNNTKLDYALKYQKMGLSIIPTGPNKKALISWKSYQEKAATEEEIINWWKEYPDANPALVTGTVSGLIALDFDSKHGRTGKEYDIEITASAKSGNNGEHYYFKYPHYKVDNKTGIHGNGFDIRGNGGYILLPPSTNDTGGKYEWVHEFNEDLSNVKEAPLWLKDIFCPKDNIVSPYHPFASRIEFEGVSEGSRNSKGASIAGKILRTTGIRLWETDGWNKFKEWNTRNIPPLDEKELRTIWDSIKTKHMTDPLSNSEEQNIAFSIPWPDKWSELKTRPLPTHPWYINNLIPRNGIVLIAGISGEGKTWVAMELAHSNVSGNPFLGKFESMLVNVLYINAEMDITEFQRRGQQLDIIENGAANLYVISSGDINLNNDNNVNELMKLCMKLDISIVIVDTFRAVASGLKEEKAEEVRAFFNRFNKFKEKNIALVFLDHFRKPAHYEGKVPKKEFLFGSQDKTASSEILLMLKSNEDYIDIYQRKNRLAREINEFRIKMTDTVVDNIKKTYITFEEEIAQNNDTKKEEAKEFVIEMLQEEGKTTKELKQVLSVKKIADRNAGDAIRELVAEGIINQGKKGRVNFYTIIKADN